MNNELSLYEEELNKLGWENEEASWEFELIEEVEPQEQNSFEDDLPIEFPQE